MTQAELKDLLIRAGWTFVQAALAVVLVIPEAQWTVDVGRTALVAGVAAVLSLVKSMAAKKLKPQDPELP